MKNHEMINGKLKQTNKTFSHLKERQKPKISEWMYEYYKNYIDKNGTEPVKDELVQAVYEKIEAREIWLPMGELNKYYMSNINKIRKRYRLAKEKLTDES